MVTMVIMAMDMVDMVMAIMGIMVMDMVAVVCRHIMCTPTYPCPLKTMLQPASSGVTTRCATVHITITHTRACVGSGAPRPGSSLCGWSCLSRGGRRPAPSTSPSPPTRSGDRAASVSQAGLCVRSCVSMDLPEIPVYYSLLHIIHYSIYLPVYCISIEIVRQSFSKMKCKHWLMYTKS